MRLPLPVVALINALASIPHFDLPLCSSASPLSFIFPLISFENPSVLSFGELGQKEERRLSG